MVDGDVIQTVIGREPPRPISLGPRLSAEFEGSHGVRGRRAPFHTAISAAAAIVSTQDGWVDHYTAEHRRACELMWKITQPLSAALVNIHDPTSSPYHRSC